MPDDAPTTRLRLPFGFRAGGPGLGGRMLLGRLGGPSVWRWMLVRYPGSEARPPNRWGLVRHSRGIGHRATHLMLGRLGWFMWNRHKEVADGRA